MAARSSYRLRSGRPTLRRGLPQAYGLVGAWAWPGGYGADLIGRNDLTPNSVPTHDGTGMITGGNGLYSRPTTSLRLQPPLTIAWQGELTGTTPDAFASIMAVTYNGNTNSSPYVGYELSWSNTASTPRFDWNSSGTFNTGITDLAGTTITSGPLFLCGTITATGQDLQQNGLNLGNNGRTLAAINYGANPLVTFGDWELLNLNPRVVHEYGLIYNRELSAPERAWLHRQGRDLFARTRGRTGWTTAAAGTATAPAVSALAVAVVSASASGRAATATGSVSRAIPLAAVAVAASGPNGSATGPATSPLASAVVLAGASAPGRSASGTAAASLASAVVLVGAAPLPVSAGGRSAAALAVATVLVGASGAAASGVGAASRAIPPAVVLVAASPRGASGAGTSGRPLASAAVLVGASSPGRSASGTAPAALGSAVVVVSASSPAGSVGEAPVAASPGPDPRRGTVILVGPDPRRGTVILVGPDPRRGTATRTGLGPDPRRGTVKRV